MIWKTNIKSNRSHRALDMVIDSTLALRSVSRSVISIFPGQGHSESAPCVIVEGRLVGSSWRCSGFDTQTLLHPTLIFTLH